MNQHDRKLYEMALRRGNERFARPCTHEVVKNGHCANCWRRVFSRKSEQCGISAAISKAEGKA